MHTLTLNNIITAAREILRAQHPRAGYAHDVLTGHQAWSGADLRGIARRYGAEYARQRRHAATALAAAGGIIIATERGRLLTAAPQCIDDFGNQVFVTRRGLAMPNSTGRRCHHFV
jgi:hypothetical protein